MCTLHTINKEKMKKLVLLGAMAIICLSSCKKDYRCSFTYEQSGEEKTESHDCIGCTKKYIKDIEAEPIEYNGTTYNDTCVEI